MNRNGPKLQSWEIEMICFQVLVNIVVLNSLKVTWKNQELHSGDTGH